MPGLHGGDREVIGVLPNFLGIGAPRAGTTWLYRQLQAHNAMFLPPKRKEIHYFDRHYDRGVEWYASFFRAAAAGHDWVGEVTPDYLSCEDAPRRIRDLIPQCRFLVMLRNPVDRAYSHYAFAVRNTAERSSFESFLARRADVFGQGVYAVQIRRYLDLFPAERFLFLVYEEAMPNPGSALDALARFFDLDRHGFSLHRARHRINASHFVKFPELYSRLRGFGKWLRARDLDAVVETAKAAGINRLFKAEGAFPPPDAATRERLMARYDEDIRALEAMLGRDFAIWRQPRDSRPEAQRALE